MTSLTSSNTGAIQLISPAKTFGDTITAVIIAGSYTPYLGWAIRPKSSITDNTAFVKLKKQMV